MMESTYGNRQQLSPAPPRKLAEIIRETVQRGGSVVVPAFAVERTQKFVFMVKELMESGRFRAYRCTATAPWPSRRLRFS